MLKYYGKEVAAEWDLKLSLLKTLGRWLGVKDLPVDEKPQEKAETKTAPADMDAVRERHAQILAQQRNIDGRGVKSG